MKIPLVDLRAQYRRIKDEIDAAIREVVEGANFILGEAVQELEREIAAYCGSRWAVGVASGTDALTLSLLAVGVERGDVVVTTPFTFIATTEAVRQAGGEIQFVDVEPRTFNLNPAALRRYLEDECVSEQGKLLDRATRAKVRAVIVVHLYGHPVDLDAVKEITQAHGLALIEDCAQAFGARYRGQPVGGIGHAGCLSFFPSKNLGGYGDGGMVVTNEQSIADAVRMLRVHGCRTRYYHLMDGYNSRLDTLQAAVLRVKLRHLDDWNRERRERFGRYNQLIKSKAAASRMVRTPLEPENAAHAAYAYTIAVRERSKLQEFLKQRGIETAVYYPHPLHRQPVYEKLRCGQGSYPHSESASELVLSLPLYPELTPDQQEYVVSCVDEFCRQFLQALGAIQ